MTPTQTGMQTRDNARPDDPWEAPFIWAWGTEEDDISSGAESCSCPTSRSRRRTAWLLMTHEMAGWLGSLWHCSITLLDTNAGRGTPTWGWEVRFRTIQVLALESNREAATNCHTNPKTQ